MTPFVGASVEAEGLLAIAAIGDDRRGTTCIKPQPQFGTVIGFVAEKLLRRPCTPDQTLGWRAVMDFASTQKDAEKTALSICDCMDFRVAPAA